MKISKQGQLDVKIFNDAAVPIAHFLARPDVYDLCINKPEQVYLLTAKGWEEHNVPSITENWCDSFVKLVSNLANQATDKRNPILSAELLTGERIQAVTPPVVRYPSITIRRPQTSTIPLANYAEKGLLLKSRNAVVDSNIDAIQAKYLYDNNDSVEECLKYAIEKKLNIIFSGATGSGKTTIANTLSQYISPSDRIVSIEDSAELNFSQDNVVSMYYARNKKNPVVTPDELLASCMRMTPTRIIFGELRGAEAFFYVDQINTGHRGSITTIHANSAPKALKRLVKLIKRSDEGKGFSNEEIIEDIREEIGVIFQWNKHGIDHAFFPSIEEL